MILPPHRAETIRKLRINHEQFRPYLDTEIAHVYSVYCEMFHCAGWTVVDEQDFVKWAFSCPMELHKGRT